MKLLPHEAIPAEPLAALQRALDEVERCQAAMQEAGKAVHLANKHVPDADQRPKEDIKSRYWDHMRSMRDFQVDFACTLVKLEELALIEANQQLGAEVEKFRPVVASMYALPYGQRSEQGCRLATMNLIACDNLCTSLIDNTHYDDWPRSVSGRKMPDEWQMHTMFKANARAFTYRSKEGDCAWSYWQDRFGHWLSDKIPSAPCLTQEEAELHARGWAGSLARSTRAGIEFTVEVWDIENQKPGSFSVKGVGTNTDPDRGGLHVSM